MKKKSNLSISAIYTVLFSSLVWLLSPMLGASQNHDYIWDYGPYFQTINGYFGDAFYFGKRPPESKIYRRKTGLFEYTHTMADSTGLNVLYHSEGFALYNRLGNIMENGDTLNPRHESWTEDIIAFGGYPTPLSGLSVPFPGRPSEYLYFHQRVAVINFSQVIGRKFVVRDVYYTHIDMAANGGLGRVVSKNNPLYEDFSTGTGLTKKGDNQGWWLVHGTFEANIYYTYTVDSAGVSLQRIDTLGQNIYAGSGLQDWPGLSDFSPDGTKFVRTDIFNGITLMDFDRCTGQLSNARYFPIGDGSPSVSVAFSPNSRFIYYNNRYAVMQLDTWAAPDENSIDTIAYFDDMSSSNEGNQFAYSELAPDGKIYIAPVDAPFYHVIERPDLLGQACGFRQRRGSIFPESNLSSIPHFPNYRLAATNCD